MVPMCYRQSPGRSPYAGVQDIVVKNSDILVDSEPRFLYSCGARLTKERGTIPESINRNVT
jgi:hypothetical protein